MQSVPFVQSHLSGTVSFPFVSMEYDIRFTESIFQVCDASLVKLLLLVKYWDKKEKKVT